MMTFLAWIRWEPTSKYVLVGKENDSFDAIRLITPEMLDRCHQYTITNEGIDPNMSRRVLCTVNLGGFLRPNVRESFLDACARWGCDYFEITERDTEYRHFIDVKLDMCRMEQLARCRVMYIDADAIIHQGCPDPWMWVPEGYFAGVQNDQGFLDQVCQRNQQLAWDICADVVMPRPPYVGWMINGGVWFFETSAHADLFDTCRDVYQVTKGERGDEQAGMSVCIAATGTPYINLPRLFNCVGPITFKAWPTLPAWITHYAKYGPHRRENTAELMDGADWRGIPCCEVTEDAPATA